MSVQAIWALRCLEWVVAQASVVLRWLGTDELGGPTGAINPSPDVEGGVLPVDLWTAQARCPQIHRHRDHNSKAIFRLVAPGPITSYPPQTARNRNLYLDIDRNNGVTNSRFSAYGYDWNQGLVTGFNDVTTAPEPATLAVFGMGLLGLVFGRRARST